MIVDEIFSLLKNNVKGSPKYTSSGWMSFNAPCCPHVDARHRRDRLKRGGIKHTDEGGLVYHCFNCNYSASWKPGYNLSKKMKDLMTWFDISDSTIKNLSFRIWSHNKEHNDEGLKTSGTYFHPIRSMNFESIELPFQAKPLLDSVIESPNKDNIDQLKYISSRGEYIESRANDFLFTTSKQDRMNRRVIIPFYWEDNLVGYSGRTIDNDRFRYFGNIPADYIFNTEVIKKEHKYVIVVEGPFDALSINGVALLGDKCSETQARWLTNLNKDIIVVPDRENNGGKLAELGNKHGWKVSNPDWDQDIKDCADATRKFGIIYALTTIIKSAK